MDGRTAMASGESQWITGAAARADVQRLRARSSAIVTGAGTLREDDPLLTVRSETFSADPSLFARIAKKPSLIASRRRRRFTCAGGRAGVAKYRAATGLFCLRK